MFDTYFLLSAIVRVEGVKKVPKMVEKYFLKFSKI